MQYIRIISLAALLLAITGVFALSNSQNVAAVSGADWQAGRIIDDSLFYNGNAMSVEEIQQFLNNRVSSCDTWGTKPHSSGQSRADYGRSVGTPPPYICLKDFYEHPTTHATNFNSTATAPSGSISAAQIIWSAAHDFNVSPKALLATLQKEAADNLIGDDWPWPTQYRSAMGYGCPDTAPCDAEYYGFYNQMYNAARQLRRYATYPEEYRYKAGADNFVQYNPVASCSGTNVFIKSQATASLYNYTPYQPNQAALDNLYGSGNSCSAYGNRNFWRIYSDWFGSTTGSLWRTESDGTLYLVEGGRKYIINSTGHLEQFGFGPQDIRFVSQPELSAVPLASSPYSSSLGQLVKSTSDSDADGGSVYFFDSGRKVPIASMEQLANFGFNVSEITYLPLDFIQRYGTDAVMSSFVRDPNQSIYQMENGKKRIFFELNKYNQVNPGGSYTNLSSFSLARWQYGQPQIDGSYLITGPDGSIRLYNGSAYYVLSAMSTYECWGLTGLRSYRLSGYEFVNGTSSGTLRCVGRDSTNTTYLLDGAQKYQIPNDASASTPADDVFTRIQTKSLPTTIRNAAGEISVIESNVRRPLASMITYNSLNLSAGNITQLTNGAYNSLTVGNLKLAAGNLVLDETGTISVVNNDLTRYLLPSASRFNDYAYNWSALIRIPSSSLGGYSSMGTISNLIKLSNVAYLVDGGTKYLIPSDLYPAYGVQLASLPEAGSAAVLANATQQTATKFIMDKNGGTVYMLEDGKKRPISSWSVLLRESNNSPTILQLTTPAVSQYATGTIVY